MEQSVDYCKAARELNTSPSLHHSTSHQYREGLLGAHYIVLHLVLSLPPSEEEEREREAGLTVTRICHKAEVIRTRPREALLYNGGLQKSSALEQRARQLFVHQREQSVFERHPTTTTTAAHSTASSLCLSVSLAHLNLHSILLFLHRSQGMLP